MFSWVTCATRQDCPEPTDICTALRLYSAGEGCRTWVNLYSRVCVGMKNDPTQLQLTNLHRSERFSEEKFLVFT